MSIEVYNKVSGRALAIRVMDQVRAQHAAGTEITCWSITTALIQQYQFPKKFHHKLYKRISTLLKELEQCGDITRTMRWDPEKRMSHNLIAPCSATSKA